MSLVRMYNVKTSITNVHDSKSYWDKEEKQLQYRKKLIGKIDPDTGLMIPTGKMNIHGYDADSVEFAVDIPYFHVAVHNYKWISELELKLKRLKSPFESYENAMDRTRSIFERKGGFK